MLLQIYKNKTSSTTTTTTSSNSIHYKIAFTAKMSLTQLKKEDLGIAFSMPHHRQPLKNNFKILIIERRTKWRLISTTSTRDP